MKRGRSIPGSYRTRPTLTVNGYSDKWLRQGFPWVYPNEVTSGRPVAGEHVLLRSPAGEPLGVGVADEGWIAARRFRDDDGPIDLGLLTARLAAAHARRARVVGLDTTAWRLVNAENDDLPGVRVDVWGAHVVVSLDSPSLLGLLEPLLDAIEATIGSVACAWLAWRPDPRDRDLGTPRPAGPVRGTPADELEVLERGVRFLVRPGAGKDVGLFPDMRDNRAWLDPAWSGASLLNLFAHTGAFSVFAARGGGSTVTVDLSQGYLDRAAANFRVNGLPPGELLAEDSFKALDRFRRQGRLFDRVILDPPGHSHSKDGTWSGEQDYARLVSAAARVVAPNGWLIAASNLGSVSPHKFHGMLANGARKAGRTMRLLHEGGQAPDYPAALHFPEGRYLKFSVCLVDGEG